MSMLVRLATVLFAALPVTGALAQTGMDPVRLRLALDPDGKVRLVAEPVMSSPPPLLQAPLPTLNADGGAQPVAIDLSASRSDGAPCLSTSLRLGALGGCDFMVYGGLPGAVESSDLLLSLDSGRGYGFDLSYGLNWLATSDSIQATWPDLGGLPEAAATLLLPGWIGPALDQALLRGERLGMGAYLWLGPDLRLNLGYEHAQGASLLFQPGVASLSLSQQDSLALGLSYGRLHGSLIGRHLRPDSPLSGFSMDSLDLGFSWRMPWNAALEFGARNLIVKPRPADGDQREPDQGDLRVPYLRYHQEL